VAELLQQEGYSLQANATPNFMDAKAFSPFLAFDLT
jgi:hypothetical protein